MALDFPDSPAVGDLYGSTGTVWRWDGARWAATAGASGARGVVGYAAITTSQAGITTVADIAGLSVTFTAVAGRRYKITAEGYLGWGVGGAGEQGSMSIRDGSGNQLQSTFEQMWTAGLFYKQHCEVVISPASGPYTAKVSCARVSGTSSGTFQGTASAPAFILVEDITYEAGSAGGGPLVPSWATATIPGLNWFVSGGAGSSAGNPRALTMANFTTNDSGITLTDSNTAITFNTSGFYQLAAQVQVLGHWVCWVQFRQLRSSTTINGATAQDARGTWGNPPGVTGFDTSYVKAMAMSTILGVVPGDKVQPIIWTSGGADATSVAGDNAGYSRVSIARIG